MQVWARRKSSPSLTFERCQIKFVNLVVGLRNLRTDCLELNFRTARISFIRAFVRHIRLNLFHFLRGIVVTFDWFSFPSWHKLWQWNCSSMKMMNSLLVGGFMISSLLASVSILSVLIHLFSPTPTSLERRCGTWFDFSRIFVLPPFSVCVGAIAVYIRFFISRFPSEILLLDLV